MLLGGAAAALAACAGRPGTERTAAPPPDVPVTLSTRWEGRPDGPLPDAGDEGVPFALSLSGTTEPPVVRGGTLVSGIPAGSAGAVYVLQDLGRRVQRIGARMGFGPGATSGSVALVAFASATDLSAHCHMVFTPDRWIAGVVADGGVVEIDTRYHESPVPQDGRPVSVDVRFDGTTAYVQTPDGVRHTLRDARFGRTDGRVACWEFYKDTPSSAEARFHETWAG
ncbi:hypothetical protein JD79_01027 [Geodermatophilus normandii]|uniref:Uncharacterized protein n=1 Tax=Geodermatophilus normandii TaxID=1137989 RepID=A0A317QHZ9_9ACTN|nr:hypothetical protein JD79_01027 [Geodermatophilus normandii]